MKVLIADKFQSSGLDALTSLGCDVVFQPDLTAEALPEAIGQENPAVLIVRSKRVRTAAFDCGRHLSLVIRAGAGYDTIDVAAASARGVFVANCPGKNSMAVAELAWALILSCDRRVPDQTIDLRNGVWNKKEYSKASGLYGRTLGIVGLGRVGREVMKRGKAFGMKIVAWSRSLTPECAAADDIGFCASPIGVAEQADVVTIHVAATDDTRHLVNDRFCKALKPGAILVNTSRGSVVDEDALHRAIGEKGIRIGLDVYATEPGSTTGEFTDDIVKDRGVYGTHHVGASTDQAQEAIAEEAIRIVQTFKERGHVVNCVNLTGATTATNVLTIRMFNKPGVLAHVFYLLGQAGINVEEMENIIYQGAKAACSHIQLDEAPGPDLLTAICANPNVLSASVSTAPACDQSTSGSGGPVS